MIWLLDTNLCIGYLRGRSLAIRERFHAARPQDLVVCSVVKAELLYGAQRSHFPERNLASLRMFLAPLRSLAFDDECAERYAEIRVRLEKAGTLIGPNDLLIAAIARVHGATLVTHNVREFSRVEGLRLEDWEAM